ncbi:VIT1/CCC1 family protein [Dactylosporangium sp. NPDC049140]|uniref:VIT1/CCC1 family protein n=1 Tax=Dactylosporangium sp. NPDC049140 TaxID=3155647 RepID=UPI0033C43585
MSATQHRQQIGRWRELLASERDAAELYDRLAAAETGERRAVLAELAAVERRHAAHWETKLREAGADVPARAPVSVRTRVLGLLARRWSVASVLPLVERAEKADAGRYDQEPDAAASMAAEERGHARTIAALIQGGRPDSQAQIARRERWHRGDRSGSLRAGVFGVSDGLVSNTALVMGFAGSGSSRSAILLAGVAGLLAGAFSMAAGEYVSMSSQREMYQRELSLEAQELAESPAEEREELVLLYRAKGLDRAQAERVADRLMADHEVALDTLAREELGLDPGALGSPWSAALSSLVAFAIGACVVVIPYLFGGGTAALVAAIVLFVLALVAVGAGTGALNGRSRLRSAARQLLAGGLAAIVTFGVGHLIGVSVS